MNTIKDTTKPHGRHGRYRIEGNMKKEPCELIQANRQIFDIDVRETDKNEYVKSKVSEAIFYSLDFETAVNSGTAKIGHEKDGFPYFIEWNEPLNFRQMYYIVNFICAFGKKEPLPPSFRGRSCPAAVGVLWAFHLSPFFGRFRGVWRVGGVFVRAWRSMGLYGLIFAPWRVLRCALRVRLPLSRDFSPVLARFAVGDR